MKILGTHSLFAIALISFVGCSQPKQVTTTDIDDHSSSALNSSHQEQRQKEAPQHVADSPNHVDRHAFADPLELAKKWNDPDRDKWQRPKEILAALALDSGAVVADLGAGTGYMVAHLSKAVGKDGTVIAIDAEPAMIEYLESNIQQLGPAKVIPQKVGYDDPGLATSSVDSLLTLDTWHHVRGRVDYAKKVYDGLKSGGRFVVVDYDVDSKVGPPKSMRLDPKEVVTQLKAAGFRAGLVSESMPRQFMVIGHKD